MLLFIPPKQLTITLLALLTLLVSSCSSTCRRAQPHEVVRQAGEKPGETTAAWQRAASQLFLELLATPRLMLEILSMRCVEKTSCRACGIRGQLGETLADLMELLLKLRQLQCGRRRRTVRLDGAPRRRRARGARGVMHDGVRQRIHRMLVQQAAQPLLLRMRALPLEGSAAYIGNR